MLSEEDIGMVMAVCETSREQSIILLTKYATAEKSIQAYFDEGPEKALQQESRVWDEAPPYHNSEIPYGPAPLENSMLTGAPSRPPSRIGSHRSLVDLTQEHAQAGTTFNLSREQQEEHDYQQAISNSMSEMPPGQQTGVTGIGQQFGPANKDYDYEKDSWAMVPRSAAREVISHPDPGDRQRKVDEPAFLRPSHDVDRLPSLLTIYHSIPLAREALMLEDVSTPRYGQDNQWWNGQTIMVPKITAVGEDRSWEDVVFEVQRIIAFLDSTHRAYGSTEAFATLDWYRFYQSETDLTKFLESWDKAAMYAKGQPIASTVFGSVALKNEDGGLDRGAKKDFYCLEPPIEPEDRNLYDVLDRIIWHDTPDTDFDDTFIAQLGDIFTAQFSNDDTTVQGCDIEFPAVWYPDRYLQDNRREALEMRQRAQEHRRAANKIDRQMERVLQHRMSDGRMVDAKETLLKAAIAAETVGKNKTPNGVQHELLASREGKKEVSGAEVQSCVSELRAIVERIDQKVAALNSEKARALEAFQEVSSEMTILSDNPAKPPTNKYTLEGVATLPYVTYFHRKRQVDLLDAETVNNDEWEWWRASFSREDAKLQREEKQRDLTAQGNEPSSITDQPGLSASQLLDKSEEDHVGYTLRKVSQEDVLKAAREESKSVLLVYASEKAVKHQGPTMSPHLQTFVNIDNEAFAAELRSDPQDIDFEMISNKSSATLANEEYHGLNIDSDLEPLIHVTSPGSEHHTSPLSPQSAGTVPFRRGGDDDETQPSPKRPKGYDERIPYVLSQPSGDTEGTPQSSTGTLDTITGEDDNPDTQHVEFSKPS